MDTYGGSPLASESGWFARLGRQGPAAAFIDVFHQCWQPPFFDHAKRQTPGAVFGNPVNDIPEKTAEQLYEEGRKTSGAWVALGLGSSGCSYAR